jgi:hypothetical protein
METKGTLIKQTDIYMYSTNRQENKESRLQSLFFHFFVTLHSPGPNMGRIGTKQEPRPQRIIVVLSQFHLVYFPGPNIQPAVPEP